MEGCRFGDSCHFFHTKDADFDAEVSTTGAASTNANLPFQLEQNNDAEIVIEKSGTNNNNMPINMLKSQDKLQVTEEKKVSETESDEKPQEKEETVKEAEIVNVDPIVYCGACRLKINVGPMESYCNLLKDHYVREILEKEGEHVKYLKQFIYLDLGQMYWCKPCALVFDKPWSLVQHLADKSRAAKLPYAEKKAHSDIMEIIAGLLAGYDLGLLSLIKVQTDFQNLLTEQTPLEDFGMEYWDQLQNYSMYSPWMMPSDTTGAFRWHQREMMRKLEHVSKQIMRRANNLLHNGRSRGNAESDNVNNKTGSTTVPSGKSSNLLANETTVSKSTDKVQTIMNQGQAAVEEAPKKEFSQPKHSFLINGGQGDCTPDSVIQQHESIQSQANASSGMHTSNSTSHQATGSVSSAVHESDEKGDCGGVTATAAAKPKQSFTGGNQSAGGPNTGNSKKGRDNSGYNYTELKSLLAQNIKPWQPEAAAALEIFRTYKEQ